MKNAVILLTKAPSSGVKQRIANIKGVEYAQKLYEDFLRQITKTIGYYELLAFIDPIELVDEVKELVNAKEYLPQEGNNLGEKIMNAINTALDMEYSRIVLISSDSPTIPKDYIDQAFTTFNIDEMVIGPSEDGGFYLIGSSVRITPRLFEGVEWGESNVFDKLLANIHDLDITYNILTEWYDIDTVEQAEKYLNEQKS